MNFKEIAAIVLFYGTFAGSLMAQEFSFAGEHGMEKWSRTKHLEVKTGKETLTLIPHGVDAKIYKRISLVPGNYRITVDGKGAMVLVLTDWSEKGKIATLRLPIGAETISLTGKFNLKKIQNVIFCITPATNKQNSAEIKSMRIERLAEK